MSKVNGDSNTSSSRFAERSIETTRSPLGMCRPSISTSTFAVRVQYATGDAQRNTSSTAPGRTDSSSRYRSICSGFGDECLQSDGQRVLGGVAAGEGQHEEEELEFVGWQTELLTVVTGDDRGRQRAPDVVGGIASLLRGELHRVVEDRGEEIDFVLLAVQLRLGRLRLQDAVEAVEDPRPVFLRYADDVADDRHRQRVGDILDPVALPLGEEVGRSSARRGPGCRPRAWRSLAG